MAAVSSHPLSHLPRLQLQTLTPEPPQTRLPIHPPSADTIFFDILYTTFQSVVLCSSSGCFVICSWTTSSMRTALAYIASYNNNCYSAESTSSELTSKKMKVKESLGASCFSTIPLSISFFLLCHLGSLHLSHKLSFFYTFFLIICFVLHPSLTLPSLLLSSYVWICLMRKDKLCKENKPRSSARL